MADNTKGGKATDELLGHQLVQLVARGANVLSASQALNISPDKARRLYKKQLSEVADNGTKQEVLQQELHTLGLLQRGLMPTALTGDTQAVKSMLAIMDRRSKYLGLDEAQRVQIEVNNINDAVRDVVTVIEGDLADVQPLRRVLPPGEEDVA